MHDVAQDRDALYYPRIRIPSVDWLKATLLCFPRVVRIVPPWYQLNDDPEVAEFTRLTGPRGAPLLCPANLYGPSVQHEQRRLLKLVQEHEELLCHRFAQPIAEQELGWNAGSFEIHGRKMLEDLVAYLEKRKLAWRARSDPDGYQWKAVHPKLGRAIMSTLAMGIAKDEGLDIVTPNDTDHLGLVRSTDEDVFLYLLEEKAPQPAPRLEELVDDISELVMVSAFDVKRLTPANIRDLINDGLDLRRFKAKVLEKAKTIPSMADRHKRDTRIRDAARELLDEWEQYRKSLPRFAVEAILDLRNAKWTDFAATGTAGALGSHFGLQAGLGLFLLTYAGLKAYGAYAQRRDSPYRYLSKIYDKGATLNVPLSN